MLLIANKRVPIKDAIKLVGLLDTMATASERWKVYREVKYINLKAYFLPRDFSCLAWATITRIPIDLETSLKPSADEESLSCDCENSCEVSE